LFKNNIDIYMIFPNMQRYQYLSDEELLNLLQQGNELAFTELYNRYWKTLLAIAYHHTRNKTIAEEIVQEVFISVWKRKNVLDVHKLPAYLATAVRWTVFKQYRQQKKLVELTETLTDTAIVWDEEKIYAKFLEEYINGIVEKLPEKCQLVFKLSRVEGLTIPEIAETMNIAEKTAEAHLTKALKTIKLKVNHSGIIVFMLVKFLIK